MKKRYIIIPIIISFSISTFIFKNYPYNFLYTVYVKTKKIKNISYNGRNLDVSQLTKVHLDVSNNTGIFLTYGQSNSANAGEPGYNPFFEVYQFLLGYTFKYEEPSLGATGRGSSVWGMLGDKLIEYGQYESVIFSNCAFGGKSIEQLNEGIHFNYLVMNYKMLMKKYGRVDAILFHQGEQNAKNFENYYNGFSLFVENLSKEGIDIPIYLARASYCKGVESPRLISVQDRLIKDFTQVLSGPNTDLLNNKMDRYDNCHFSLSGLEKASEMWLESLTAN